MLPGCDCGCKEPGFAAAAGAKDSTSVLYPSTGRRMLHVPSSDAANSTSEQLILPGCDCGCKKVGCAAAAALVLPQPY